MKKLLALCLLLTCSACAHVPPNLTPKYQTLFRANEALNAVARVQTVAIALNGAGILPDQKTRLVVVAVAEGFPIVQHAPEGWKATISALLERLAAGLDAEGKSKLATVVLLAEAALNAVDSRDLCSAACTDLEMGAVFNSTISHALADGQRWTAAH